MKKHKIAAALVCVVFLTTAWGGVAGAQERPDVGLGYGYEWWLGGAPPPSFFVPKGIYLWPEGLTPRDNIPHVWVHDPYSGYGNLGKEPLNSGVGVPEPGTVVLLLSGGLCVLVWAWRRRHRG